MPLRMFHGMGGGFFSPEVYGWLVPFALALFPVWLGMVIWFHLRKRFGRPPAPRVLSDIELTQRAWLREGLRTLRNRISAPKK